MPNPLFNYFQNEHPMNSALNSAHFSGRRADYHLKYGRYDEAIKCHAETVQFLSIAISESTIPKNIEHLQVQRKHHENIQQIIVRQKKEFEDFLQLNGLKPVSKPGNQTSQGNQKHLNRRDNTGDNIDEIREDDEDDEFFSLVGELKIGEEHPDNKVDQVKDDDSDEDVDFVSIQ